MKNLIAILSIILVIVACSGVQKTSEQSNSNAKVENDTIKIANDSLDYELIIFEPGFNSWLVTQRPRGYYSQNFLEQKNQNFVVIYNSRVTGSPYASTGLYPQHIDYQYNIDYGYEVNYLLYHYFIYFQEHYKQNLR
ncbi:DUF6146 family protein [Mesonia aestuariivivens]|uniref:Lipoprotein n=1 Tax=Mesonia aestuariivivens TaxID=2796128 RepID=A0ABS6VYK6_9FLAO|nr:DUF6146 family protein [Mesonia aestuariivivens]MBW2960687.1 hypothetical protein [Mesonia aestuariivivens]